MNKIEISFSNDDADIAYIKLNDKYYNDVYFYHLFKKVKNENLQFVEIYNSIFSREEIFDIARKLEYI